MATRAIGLPMYFGKSAQLKIPSVYKQKMNRSAGTNDTPERDGCAPACCWRNAGGYGCVGAGTEPIPGSGGFDMSMTQVPEATDRFFANAPR